MPRIAMSMILLVVFTSSTCISTSDKLKINIELNRPVFAVFYSEMIPDDSTALKRQMKSMINGGSHFGKRYFFTSCSGRGTIVATGIPCFNRNSGDEVQVEKARLQIIDAGLLKATNSLISSIVSETTITNEMMREKSCFITIDSTGRIR